MTTTTPEPEKTGADNVRTAIEKTVATIHVDYAKGRMDSDNAHAALLALARLIENGVIEDACSQVSMIILITTIADAIEAAEKSIEEQARTIKSLTIPAVKELHREMREDLEK